MRLSARLARLCLGVTNRLLRFSTWCLFPGAPPNEPRHVFVHRVGRIGDALAALDALRAVRAAYPSAHLVLLTSTGDVTKPGAAALLENASWLDEVRTYGAEDAGGLRSALAWARALRAEPIDVWISLPQNLSSPWVELRNLLFARLAGARWARGFAVGGVAWLGRSAARALAHSGPGGEQHVFEQESVRLLDLLGRAGIAPATGAVAFELPAEARDRARELLVRHDLDRGPLLALAPGAKRPANRWPTDRFAELARRWVELGHPAVVLGGPEDREAGRALEAQGAVSLAGETDLPTSAALLERARLLVSNDSGPMHLATAVSTPVVALFSARDVRGRWYPAGAGHRVLRHEPDCSPCWLDECPIQDLCLSELSVERAWEALQDVASIATSIDPAPPGPLPPGGDARGASGDGEEMEAEPAKGSLGPGRPVK